MLLVKEIEEFPVTIFTMFAFVTDAIFTTFVFEFSFGDVPFVLVSKDLLAKVKLFEWF